MMSTNKPSDSKQQINKATVNSNLPPNVEIIASKAISSLFTIIRNKNTSNADYVFHCDRLCRILAEEGLAALCTDSIEIETECGLWTGPRPINPKFVCAVSIVRSGDILLEAVRSICPGLAVGKILMQRNEETKEKNAVHYYTKLPGNISKMKVLLVDPMIGTGGSACGALNILKQNGCSEDNIIFLNTICAKEGLLKIYDSFPGVKIITCAIDPKLNEHKFLVPGLGDFGDRYHRTGGCEDT